MNVQVVVLAPPGPGLISGVWTRLTEDPPRQAYSSPPPSTKTLGMPIPEAIVHFVKHNPYRPTSADLLTFMREADAVLQALKSRPWEEQWTAAVELMKAEGIDPPPPWLQYSKQTGVTEKQINAPSEGIPGAVRRADRHAARITTTEERCVAGVVAFIRTRRPGEKVTRSAYAKWSVGKEWPSPSSFKRHGGWDAIKAKALEQALPF